MKAPRLKRIQKQMSAPECDALYSAHCYATCSRELGFVSLNALVFHISFLAKLQPSERKPMKKKSQVKMSVLSSCLLLSGTERYEMGSLI